MPHASTAAYEYKSFTQKEWKLCWETENYKCFKIMVLYESINIFVVKQFLFITSTQIMFCRLRHFSTETWLMVAFSQSLEKMKLMDKTISILRSHIVLHKSHPPSWVYTAAKSFLLVTQVLYRISPYNMKSYTKTEWWTLFVTISCQSTDKMQANSCC